MPRLKTLVSEVPLDYDGTQLAPHFLYKQFDLLGDGVVAFVGRGEVKLDHMVDLTDVKKNAPIYSPKMVHFLGEFFIDSFQEGIWLQHLFVCNVYEWLWENGVTGLRRRGNDIYVNDRKFSVSIATKSPVSVLLHFAANVLTEGTPVPTAGLRELDIDPLVFARAVLEKFSFEMETGFKARVKATPRT